VKRDTALKVQEYIFTVQLRPIIIFTFKNITSSPPVVVSCEHGNQPFGSIKCWEVLE
jgi:hypothetical protein